MVSYDTVDMAKTKVGYIQGKALGGAMWWESSGDKNGTDQSIISNVSHIHPAAGRGGPVPARGFVNAENRSGRAWPAPMAAWQSRARTT